jgi:hypothetical protein
MLRIGQQLGVAGADANEQLANTRIVVQGLAQQELDAAAQMRGQGSLTEGERGILKRAAAGDQTLSAAEIRQALASAQKTARYRLVCTRRLFKTSNAKYQALISLRLCIKSRLMAAIHCWMLLTDNCN